MGERQRRYKRFKVDVMEINGTMMFANEVEILDISIGGLSIRADRRLNMGTEYSLKIMDKNNVIQLKAQVMWSRLSGTKKKPGGEIVPLYTAGMRFSGLAGEGITELTKFIAERQEGSHEEVDVHCLSGLRFHIRFDIGATEKAVLKHMEGYQVKKISLGGMLIQSAHEIGVDERLPMELSLPGDEAIVFSGRVASCLVANREEPLLYDVGIDFADMEESDRERLAAFLGTLSRGEEGGEGVCEQG